MIKRFGIAMLFIITIFMLWGCGGDGGEDKITLEQYSNIENGMTLEEVENILGQGEENASTEAGGVIVKSYQWTNKDGSNIQIMFQDGKVNTKAQAGLE